MKLPCSWARSLLEFYRPIGIVVAGEHDGWLASDAPAILLAYSVLEPHLLSVLDAGIMSAWALRAKAMAAGHMRPLELYVLVCATAVRIWNSPPVAEWEACASAIMLRDAVLRHGSFARPDDALRFASAVRQIEREEPWTSAWSMVVDVISVF